MAFSPERLPAVLEDCLRCADEPAAAGLCVALSGGLDSTVLLVALVRARDAGALTRPLRSIHVDHGLHVDSATWSAACRELAGRLRVPFDDVRVDATAAHGASPEAAARAARYAALVARLGAGEVLLTAHHADDQLETLLLQWLRGGGLRSLAGMPDLARLGRGWHARPLLRDSRTELEAWAAGQQLRWLEDPSNRDTRFDRNYLRNEVLPVLRRRWPAAAQTTARVAGYVADALALLDEVAIVDLATARAGQALRVEPLAKLGSARQAGVLRAWLRGLRLPLPSARTLAALRHDMLRAAADRNPQVEWPGAVVRRYRGHLYAEPGTQASWRTGEWCWQETTEYALNETSRLELVPDVGRGLSRERLPPLLHVGRRAEGESFQPAGAAHHAPLRKWYQQRAVLPWRRDDVPLLRHGAEIVAIADFSCAEAYAARPGERSWRIDWHGRPRLTTAEWTQVNWSADPPIL